MNNTSCSSVSSTSSETLRQVYLSLPHVPLSPSNNDPRAALLHHECEVLHVQLQRQSSSTAHAVDGYESVTLATTTTGPTRRRSSGRQRPDDRCTTGSSSVSPTTESAAELDHGRPVGWEEETQSLQLVQTLLPLLFELFTETTKLQTRLRCLEAIQRWELYFFAKSLVNQ